MGNSFCSDSDTIQTTQEYLGSLADITPKNGVSGGSVNYCNKYGGLENYANSVPSKSKEYLIRSIAKHATDVLKIKANVSQDGDLLDIIEKLKKVLPDPSNGRNIKTDSKVHKDVCKKLGTAINKAFDNNVVNLNESSEDICLKVSQVLNSLSSGLNNEFVGVSNDISKIVKNLNVLQDYMDNIYKKLSNETPNSSMIEDLYKSISKEIKKQHAHLAGLVNGVIGPTKISLINLLESGEMPGLSSDMKAIAGTRAFSDRISHTLYNSGNVSHAAYLVNDALNQIGMSLNEYKNANSLKKLNSNMFDNMVKNKPSSNEINKMMGAYTILLNNDLSHDDIVDYLSKKGGFEIYGGDDVLDELNSESFAELVGENLYDDYDSAFKGRKHADKKSIGRTLRKRAIFREKLFSTLNEQIKSKYTTIIMNLYKIGKKLGSEIKISNNIRLFIKQLVYFEQTQPDRYNLHKALSGYRTDVKSEYIKHDFIKSLESVVNISAICDNEVGGGYFKDITNSINGLLKVVDDFNATFTKSLTEIHVDADRSATGGDIFGGVAESEFKYLVTMKKAVRELEWYFKISNIKGSLKVAASQQKNYTADYENILGEECGILIDKINETFKLLTCENDNDILYSSLNDKGKSTGTRQEPTKCIIHTLFKSKCLKPGTINAAEEKIWDAYIFLMEYMRSANVDMIEAAQAIDLYLSAFTEQAQNNPDEIKDFLKMLEQLEIVAKWFTDKSGDNLAFVFESFGKNYSLDKPTTKIEASSHYYTDLKTKNANPADHTNGIEIVDKNQVKEFIIRLEKSFKSMRALENIISTFSKINISSKNTVNPIMSPGLIFKAFTKYAIASSIGILKCTQKSDDDGDSNGDGDDDGDDDGNEHTHIVYDSDYDSDNGSEQKYGGGGTYKSFYEEFRDIKLDNFKIYLMDVDKTVCNPLHIGDINVNYNKSYIQPIEIFEMCIKSMVSKVAIVVGIYSLFQKPAHGFINNNSLSNNPLRQILGGSSTPKIIPDAVELYVRLTLLGEWYRELFNFKSDNATGASDNLLISMIPSFDGIWNKFIKVIFVDAAGVTEGGYTESFSIDIVESINDIYTHYKSKYGSDICIKVMENFVAEINLRYGIVKQDEINNYIADKDRGISNSGEYDADDNVNFDILDADTQFTRSKVPSDKFRKSTYKNIKKTGLLHKNFKQQIDAFRKTVYKNLTLEINDKLNPKFGDLGVNNASVDDLIIQTKSRVNSADDDASKFKVIQTTIMGVDQYSNIDYDVMLMFHETVINPLTILYTVYKIINQWNKFAIGCLEKYTTPDDVKNLMRGKVYEYDNAIQTDLYKEYDINHGNVPVDIVNRTLHHLFYLTCDKNPLVEMYFSNSGKYKYPMLSFKKLEEYVIPLVECVEKSLNKFRNILPHNIISKYENNMYAGVTNPDGIVKSTNIVSLFFIKEHLVDRLIKNKYGGGLNDSNTFLMKSWDNNVSNYYNIFYNSLFLLDTNVVTARDVYTNYMKYPINQIGAELLPGGNRKSIITQISESKNPSDLSHPLIKGFGLGFMNVYDYDDKEFRSGSKIGNIYGLDGCNGLIFKFNRLIFHYINMFIDSSSGKIYLPLLEKFANGINAGEIMRGNSIDDITLSTVDPTKPMFTDTNVLMGEKSVIFATQTAAIKNLVTFKISSSSSSSILKFAEPNLLNISEYMKDLMTAYLPIFEKHLNLIIGRTDMLRTILEQSNFNLDGNIPGDDIPTSGVDGYAQKLKVSKKGSSVEIKSYFINVLSYLGSSAKSLQKCVRESYKELNDLPIYFETYKNSISDYKNRNNILPFMPLSHVSHLLNNNIRIHESKVSKITAPIDESKNQLDSLVNIYNKYQENRNNYNTNSNNITDESIIKLQSDADKLIMPGKYVNEYNNSYSPILSKYIECLDLTLNNIKPIKSLNNSVIVIQTWSLGENVRNTLLQYVNGGKFNMDITQLINLIKDRGIDPINFNSMAISNFNRIKSNFNYNKYDIDIVNLLEYSFKTELINCNDLSTQLITKLEFNSSVLNYIESETDIDIQALKQKFDYGINDMNDIKISVTKIHDLIKFENKKYDEMQSFLNDIDKKIYNTDSFDDSPDVINQFNNKSVEIINAINASNDSITTYKTQSKAFNENKNKFNMSVNNIKTELNKIVSLYNLHKLTIETYTTEFNKYINSFNNAYKNYKAIIDLWDNADKINNSRTKGDSGINKVNYNSMYDDISSASERKTITDLNLVNRNHRDKFNKIFYKNNTTSLQDKYKFINVNLKTTDTGSLTYGGASTQNNYYTYKGLIPHKRVGVGSDEFKFAYGTRGLLSDNNEPNIELAPGVISILDMYNSKMGGSASYDKRHMVDCFKYSTYLLRYAVDYVYHKTYLCDEEIDKATEFFHITGTYTDGTGTVVSNNILHNLSCQTGKHEFGDSASEFFIKTQNITLLLENDSYKHSLKKMMECITASASNSIPTNRKELRIYNILDANIVPINFHALQREIPLINLFNYSHTFDLLVRELNKEVDGNSNFTINVLVKHLRKPFEPTKAWNAIGQIMIGNDGLELNRPKYLSDQLWGKVLLMEEIGTLRQLHNASRQNRGHINSSHLSKSNNKHKFVRKVVSTKWGKIGKERYKTYIVRYMEWFVHLQRYMRYIMRNQLAWVSDPIAHKNNAISESITEYEGNRIFNLQEFE